MPGRRGATIPLVTERIVRPACDGPRMDGPTFQLSQDDAVAWLRARPSESADLIITDPPYESLEKHRAIGTTTRLKNSKASSNDWFSIFPNERFPELFAEVYRVLRRNSHFYLFCDPETMFVAKPIAEQAGFKFWKPLIWDKCLGPETLVWTERGAVRISDIEPGDRVALPNGGSTPVLATRRVRAPAVRITLSDGVQLVASREHRFVRASGDLAEAGQLLVEDALRARPVRLPISSELDLNDVIPDEDAVHELPETTSCLWCGEQFDSFRAASAHQARWCEAPSSKQQLAERLGIPPKRLRWWMQQRRIPRAWAHALSMEGLLGPRVQCAYQNDVEIWYPRTLALDYELGKVVGLYAAEGSWTAAGVSFAFHASEKHLHATVARFARALGLHARLDREDNRAIVRVDFKLMKYLIGHFVGGDNAREKYLKPTVYATPGEFRRGVLDGLLEGDGHWSHHEQRQTYTSASPDLVMFARRELAAQGREPVVRRVENTHAGAWVLRFDPSKRGGDPAVTAIEDIGEQDLVDISVADRDELFLLANGIVTHNCTIGMGYHYRARYECVLFFEKGKRKLHDLGVADIITAKRIVGGYPAEKPVTVSEVLIRQSSEPGQLVLDPFIGSGSVGVAAVQQGRSFLGNDLCAEAVDIARGRLREAGAREVIAELAAPEVGQLGLLM
jgi:DNA modification methylase